MPKAYSYIRFSTPEQSRGDSLRRQTVEAEKWCAARAMVLDETLRDIGISAHKGANAEVGSALGNFLIMVRNGKVEKDSYLIVESLDRLSRENVLDALPRFLDLLRAGIRIVTLTDNQEYSADSVRDSWHQLIVSLSVMARAHDESRLKGIRVSEAWANKRAKARRGEIKMTKRAPEWLILDGDEFHLREDRVSIVRRIFSKTIDGYGRRTIANGLNVEGVPAFRDKGNGWHSSSVAKILHNRAVIGEYQPGTGSHQSKNYRSEGDPIADYYPRIVEDSVFWRAQQAMQERRNASGRRGKGMAHLLIGLGKCARCNGAMHLINKGAPPKGSIYFECTTARRKMGCDNSVRWRVDVIERRLLRHISYIDADTVLRGEITSFDLAEIDSLKAQLEDNLVRRDRLISLVETGDESAVKRFHDLLADAKSLGAELGEKEKLYHAAMSDPGLKARLSEAVDLHSAMTTVSEDQRTEIRVRLAEELRGIVERVLFHPDLGVTAVLKARPEVSMDKIPWIYGANKKVPWLLSLDQDSFPHGPEPFDDMDDTEQRQRPLPLLRKR